MIIKPMVRGGVCLSAHPKGCEAKLMEDIEWARSQPKINCGKRVLILGGSAGFGLASRLISAFCGTAATLNVSFEREASDKKTGTPGYYNNKVFDREAKNDNLYAKTILADAFSDQTRQKVIDTIKNELPDGKIDLLIYSLASPVRVDPQGNQWRSVLKPLGETYSAKSIDFMSNKMNLVTIEAANSDELQATVKVMGGEDWQLWTQALLQADVLAENFKTIAYSYIGPKLTYPIYTNGTIGKAKEHLAASAMKISRKLTAVNGKAIVSVNKAVVTRASAVIPMVPLYISILFKIMKEKGTHEGCREQIHRLFSKKITEGETELDQNGMIRLDDWEMADDVQKKVADEWEIITEHTLLEKSDIEGYRRDFLQLYGFEVDGIDYKQELEYLDIE